MSKAEIKIATFISEHNIAFLAADHLPGLLQECFPDLEIAKGISIKRTKTTAKIKNVIDSSAKEKYLIIKIKMNCKNDSKVKNNDYHTPAEWRFINELEIMASSEQQELAQRLTLEADRLVDQAKDAVGKNKLEIDHQSKVKVKDIEYKCSELENQKNGLNEEIRLLLGYQTRIENAKKRLLGDALDAIAECFRLRNCRQGIDLVFDEVEKQLLQERELIKVVNSQLEDLVEKVKVQIRKLREFVYNLVKDLHCKENTLKIEEYNEKLNEKSIELSILKDKNLIKPAEISLTKWDRFTSDIILEASRVLINGRPIRAYFDKCLNNIIKRLVSQSDEVEQAFKLRVEEYLIVIENLSKQRDETIKNAEEVQGTIDKLQDAVDDKEAYIALVHTRLLNRTRRQGIELCRDELEVKLNEEMDELEHNVQCLKKMIVDTTVCQRRLKQSSARIEVQLIYKRNTLHIDDVLCAEQRKRINYRAF
ncbi:tektin-1-like [Rhopalosiphum maidis]|uniref:tektin-1-like n=1 Tax=Rhopalosiphum maidis TaxID=43146 RepID=UPI000F002F01|nr:tektin-1-like [Rhopalosiphum maidis]